MQRFGSSSKFLFNILPQRQHSRGKIADEYEILHGKWIEGLSARRVVYHMRQPTIHGGERVVTFYTSIYCS